MKNKQSNFDIFQVIEIIQEATSTLSILYVLVMAINIYIVYRSVKGPQKISNNVRNIF